MRPLIRRSLRQDAIVQLMNTLFHAESQIAWLVQRSLCVLGKYSRAVRHLSNKELPSFTVISFGPQWRRFLNIHERYGVFFCPL